MIEYATNTQMQASATTTNTETLATVAQKQAAATTTNTETTASTINTTNTETLATDAQNQAAAATTNRSAKSTNGCTVISALVVAQHLQDTQPFTTVSNETIEHVIDVQCGPILRAIRNKLRLGYQSLIVPSDVHDHLMDKQAVYRSHRWQYIGSTTRRGILKTTIRYHQQHTTMYN
jgi:hypothetical protein